MIYSCPICCADINCFNAAHLNQNLNAESQSAQHYSNYENVTFEYLINPFLVQHQLKSIPLFVCTQCNCVRVSLIDAVYHYLRNHFNKPINIGKQSLNLIFRTSNLRSNKCSLKLNNFLSSTKPPRRNKRLLWKKIYKGIKIDYLLRK